MVQVVSLFATIKSESTYTAQKSDIDDCLKHITDKWKIIELCNLDRCTKIRSSSDLSVVTSLKKKCSVCGLTLSVPDPTYLGSPELI